jgi:HK97 family phage portal protein
MIVQDACVGVFGDLRSWLAGPSESDLGQQIEHAVLERELGLGDYLGIPAVARARQLLVSLFAELEPEALRDGYPMLEQPAVLRRPAPEITRQEWLTQLGGSLFDHGNAALWLPQSSRNAAGWPELAPVIPWHELSITWADDSRMSRRVDWAGRVLVPGRDVILISLGRKAGELTGQSPLESIAPALARIIAAEIYAGEWFENGAVPSVVLKFDGVLTDAGAANVKSKYVEAHRDHSPAVLPKGWDLREATSDPESSQLLETRKHGALEIARGLGIFPAELLLAELGGSSLTYQNVADALMTLCRVTLQPVYLAPVEEALSDLVPATQAVRMNTSELERLGTAARWNAYATGIAAGFVTTEQVDRWEGWNRAAPLPIPPAVAPTPAAVGVGT